jgi:signal transduction histidine kinase
MPSSRSERGPTAHHAWERGLPLWHALFAGVLALGTGLGFLDAQLSPADVAVASVLGTAMSTAYWWMFVRSRPWSHPTRRALVYLGLITVGWAVLLRLSPTYLWFQLSLVSQAFFILSTRTAVLGVIAIAAVGLQFDLSQRTGPLGDHLPAVAASLAVTGFLAVFGVWIGTIIDQSEERHALIEALETTRHELAEQERMAGVQAERQRMAREVHDTVAQDLTAIIMHLRSASAAGAGEGRREHLAEAERIAQASLAEARRLVWALRPTPLEGSGLVEAVGRIVSEWRPSPELRARLVVSGHPRPLSGDLEVTLVRAVQEGLANVARHARALQATVSLSFLDDTVTLDIHDDGIGFDARRPPVPNDAGGFGLTAMRERVERLGGSLAVESEPGGGTTVGLRLPAAVR